jgi:radical SAM protein (TIGR01212 family)
VDGERKRWRDFKTWLRERHGATVFKLPIDAGLTCPNRDGRVGTGGCIYCDGRGSRLRAAGPLPTVSDQLRTGMEFYRERHGASLFLPYFQTFTNTYAPAPHLRALWDEALAMPGVVGLSVGTRPDSLSDEALAILSSYARDGRDIWIEFGLQSARQDTLDRINRCETVGGFVDATRRAAAAGLLVCAHVILGLPGEDDADMAATARLVAGLPVTAVKIHSLLILDGTPLAEMWRRGEVPVQSLVDYARRAADFLELIPPGTVVQRLTADGYRDILLAPDWAGHKMAVIEAIDRELDRRGTRQGSRFPGAGSPG